MIPTTPLFRKLFFKFAERKFTYYTLLMLNVWAKIVIDHKVKQSVVIAIDPDNFYDGITQIATALKIPTPVITQSQIDHFLEFNLLKLKQRDFIESIPFDILEFNAIIEK